MFHEKKRVNIVVYSETFGMIVFKDFIQYTCKSNNLMFSKCLNVNNLPLNQILHSKCCVF